MVWTELASWWQAEPGLKVAVLAVAALLVSVAAGVCAARRLERRDPASQGKSGRPRAPGTPGKR